MPDSKILLLYGLCGLVTAVSISWLRSEQKDTIPALVGSNGLISSYVAALRFVRNSQEMIRQGYYQDRNGVFRVPRLFRWDYVASGRKRILELAGACTSILEPQPSADDLHLNYMLGTQALGADHYDREVIRGGLTRNLGRCFPQVRDEMVHAFDYVLALPENEWKLVEVLPTALQVVARTSNRLFVGLPLCRELEYLQLCLNFTIIIMTRGLIIGFIPTFLRPILAPLFSARSSILRRALKLLGPLINERLEQENQYGSNWPGRPNDLVSWLLDLAEGEERTTPAIALRVLGINAAAIHTTSGALADALYDLAVHPEYILPMREEAERVIAAEGCTKAALGNLHKIDSFLRESMRLTAPGPVALGRKVVAKDGFGFSDGTTIPYGAFVGVPGTAAHCDPDNYDHADVFDGFRFSRMREERVGLIGNDDHDAGNRTGVFNRHMVSTAPDYLVFGHGRNTCPGRFFAATQLKAMLAHILIHYDIKAETDVKPPETCYALVRIPNPWGKIWIKKRK